MSRKKRKRKKQEEDEQTESLEAVTTVGEEANHDLENESHDAVSEAEADGDPSAEAPDERGSDSTTSFQELERLANEAREMRLLAQRKQAEFENYRKRIERERAETAKYAASETLKEILPVLDNLERAIESSKSGDEKQLREGVEIIYKQFRDTLSKQGLEEVDAQNAPFDPHIHEAVGRVETDQHPEGTVVEVLQKGYLYKDRLLRPSMVSVAQPAGGYEPSDDERANEDEAVPQED